MWKKWRRKDFRCHRGSGTASPGGPTAVGLLPPRLPRWKFDDSPDGFSPAKAGRTLQIPPSFFAQHKRHPKSDAFVLAEKEVLQQGHFFKQLKINGASEKTAKQR